MNEPQPNDKTYVLGTHDAEIARLGVQHRVWQPSVRDLWCHGGVAKGQTVIDIGSGPGHATLELAEIVGASGRVIAVERSHRFLDVLRAQATARTLANIETVETDLLDYAWPEAMADCIWCRWVLAFLPDPEKVLRGMARALKPNGRILLQEYYDYASWRLAPQSDEFEAYVAKIIARWRNAGGNADIGLDLARLLPETGLEIEIVRPVVFCVRTDDAIARWPMGFAREHLGVMEAAGDISTKEMLCLAALLDRYTADPNAFVITPGVLQFVARKTG